MPAADTLRDAQALHFRAQGWTYQRIANELGYTNESGARKAVQRATEHAPQEVRDEAKALILADLYALKQAAWKVLETNHITISQGRVVTIDGTPVPDDGPILDAIDRILRLDQEIAKIYGLYAPTKHEVRQVDVVDAEIERLLAELGTRGEAASSPAAED